MITASITKPIMAITLKSLPDIHNPRKPPVKASGIVNKMINGESRDWNCAAMIGFVMLAGIIVNNGIVLVDYINQLRLEGVEKKEAIARAGVTRLRPILMTAITTVLGLVPMVVGGSMGTDMTRPMAIVTIGGLIYGTILTLFVVPCIYDLVNRKEMKKIDVK